MENYDLKVLCVDDEPVSLELYSHAIKDSGLSSILCIGPADAEARFFEHLDDIVLVISDFHMPGKNGFEFRSSLLPKGRQVPFIIVSGHVTEAMVLKASELKIDGFFEKPFDEEDIVGVIDILARPRIQAIREARKRDIKIVEEATLDLVDMSKKS
jgi:DNA-binding NtrC family response regulator